jgi:hypothetical protein
VTKRVCPRKQPLDTTAASSTAAAVAAADCVPKEFSAAHDACLYTPKGSDMSAEQKGGQHIDLAA